MEAKEAEEGRDGGRKEAEKAIEERKEAEDGRTEGRKEGRRDGMIMCLGYGVHGLVAQMECHRCRSREDAQLGCRTEKINSCHTLV